MTATDPGAITGATDAVPPTMRAVVQDEFGSPDVLSVRSIERPAITDSQVLVAVEAAGLDRGTWHLMYGRPYAVRLAGFGVRKPKRPVLGMDVAGRVVAVGADVTRFSPGDEVVGVGIGTLAQLAAAEEAKLVKRPATVSWEQAGVATISGITAVQALTDVGRVESGQHVLVMGASGGVGSYTVQIAKALGAEVTGVASAAKTDLVRSLGADHVIDYTSTDVTVGTQRFDLIVDTGGQTPVRRLRRVLSRRGTLVIVGGENGGRWLGGVQRQLGAVLLSPFVRQRLTTFISPEDGGSIQRLVDMLADGSVVPAIDRVVGLDGVAQAMHDLEQGRVRGKVAVRVSPDR